MLLPALPDFASRSLELITEQPVLAFTAGLGLAAYSIVRYAKSPYRQLPPGPRGIPLLGNVFQLTKDTQWLLFSDWAKKHGDVFTIDVLGQKMVVLNSHKAVHEILDVRASNTSDRPRCIVASETLTGGLIIIFTHYNALWRRLRKAAHESLNKGVIHRYQPIQYTEALIMADSLVAQPAHWKSHLHRNAASAAMGIIYDHPPLKSEFDPAVQKINDMATRMSKAGMPGAHLVEVLPILRYVPARFAKWKREAQHWFKHDSEFLEGLFNDVRRRMDEGDNRPSIAATMIAESERLGTSERENAWAAATMYAAGAETTASVMTWWFLAMIAFPEHQRRAQEEIDRVVGRSRVPRFSDIDSLHYTQAMIRETMRWRPVAPFSMPHVSVEDDYFDGMFLPKGTTFIPNVWALNHDRNEYGPDAEDFNPQRFLDSQGKLKNGPAATRDDGHFTFGFGRRICVGKHLAMQALAMNMALVLWAMNLRPGKDANGIAKPLNLDDVVNNGLILRPVPFDVHVEIRSAEAANMLREERERTGY